MLSFVHFLISVLPWVASVLFVVTIWLAVWGLLGKEFWMPGLSLWLTVWVFFASQYRYNHHSGFAALAHNFRYFPSRLAYAHPMLGGIIPGVIFLGAGVYLLYTESSDARKWVYVVAGIIGILSGVGVWAWAAHYHALWTQPPHFAGFR